MAIPTITQGRPLLPSASKLTDGRRLSRRTLAILYLILCAGQPAVTQEVRDKTDSSRMYRSIEKFSRKSRFTKFIHRLVFKPVARITSQRGPPQLVRRSHADHQGKVVRDIVIVTLEPFGFSAADTAVIPQQYPFMIGNALHVRTQPMTVANTMLIRENDQYDSLLVMESERLIRNQNYVREVEIAAVGVEGTTDSVDLSVRVVDRWSIVPSGAVSSARVTVGLAEKNVLGFGHELQNTYAWDHTTGMKDFTANYSVPNVKNSHISIKLHYDIDERNNSGRSLAVERPFYSPLARWAAGSAIARLFQKDAIAGGIPDAVTQDIRYTTQDYWAGNANRIFHGDTEDTRTINAIIAARYYRIRYLEKPAGGPRPAPIYADEDLYLAGIGATKRSYFRDHYIYGFGTIEDVPVGRVYGLTGGYQVRGDADRWYVGARISLGDYRELGYISSTIQYGTFVHGRHLQQGVITAGVNYFSNLIEIGDWRLRQFVKPQVTWGLNRWPGESLTINDENGIRGFTSSSQGIKKVMLTIQTQSYAPWGILGFKFGPYLNGSLGMLGTASSGFTSSQAYYQFGIGALFKNDHLVLSNFQLSVAYYPSIPGSGRNIVKLNAFRTTDFGFSDFIFGKPETATYQ